MYKRQVLPPPIAEETFSINTEEMTTAMKVVLVLESNVAIRRTA